MYSIVEKQIINAKLSKLTGTVQLALIWCQRNTSRQSYIAIMMLHSPPVFGWHQEEHASYSPYVYAYMYLCSFGIFTLLTIKLPGMSFYFFFRHTVVSGYNMLAAIDSYKEP